MAGNTTRSEAQQSFFVYVRDNNTGVIKRIAIPGDVQIGLEGSPAELHLLGRLSISSKTYVVDSINKGIINISNDDTVVALRLEVTPLSNRITVKLPRTPREGQLHFIKDLTGQAGLVPIDIYPRPGYTIDGASSKTLSDAYGSLALVWLSGQWRILVAGIGASGGSGGSADATYVTINSEASLTNERRLNGSANIVITDNGPNATVVLDLSQLLVGGGTYTYADVTVDAYGRVTSISSNPAPPSINAGFLTAVNEPSLSNQRIMSGGFGTTVTDGGAGTTFSFNVDPTVVPVLNAENTFFLANVFNLGMSGSLTRLANGDAYIVGVGGADVTSASNGQVILSSSKLNGIAGLGGTVVSFNNNSYIASSSVAADKHATYLVLTGSTQVPQARRLIAGSNINFNDGGPGGDLTLSTSGSDWVTSTGRMKTIDSVSIDSLDRYADALGSDVFFYVSGTVGVSSSLAQKAVFGGDITVSGSVLVASGASMWSMGQSHFAKLSNNTSLSGTNDYPTFYDMDSSLSCSFIATSTNLIVDFRSAIYKTSASATGTLFVRTAYNVDGGSFTALAQGRYNGSAESTFGVSILDKIVNVPIGSQVVVKSQWASDNSAPTYEITVNDGGAPPYNTFATMLISNSG